MSTFPLRKKRWKWNRPAPDAGATSSFRPTLPRSLHITKSPLAEEGFLFPGAKKRLLVVASAKKLAEGLLELAGLHHPNVEFLEVDALVVARSEERRVGKECRSRWSRYH